MKIKKYVHATFKVEMGGKRILIDPGKYNFGGGRFDLDYPSEDSVKGVDILLLSHEHADHYYPEFVQSLYDKERPVIIANDVVGRDLQTRNIEHKVLKENEVVVIDGFKITATKCSHVVPAIGFVLNDGVESLYFAGDTLYHDTNIKSDVLLVPIGNRDLVMNPDEAVKFAERVGANLTIPMHYESPKDVVNPESFKLTLPYRVLDSFEEISIKK